MSPRDVTAALVELEAIRRHLALEAPSPPAEPAGSTNQREVSPVLTSEWSKSTYSNTNGSCVEARQIEDRIEVRDSKNGGVGPVLTFTAAEWNAFLNGVADDQFCIAS